VKTGLLLACIMLTSTFGWSQSQRVNGVIEQGGRQN
jgi:hypothetical protein